MIDGARMVTPGVVRQALDVFRTAPHAAVSAPGYHIGHKLQQIAVNEGYNEDATADESHNEGEGEDTNQGESERWLGHARAAVGAEDAEWNVGVSDVS